MQTEETRAKSNRMPTIHTSSIQCIQNAEIYLDVDCEPSDKEGIISAIKSLKNGKAPKQDNVKAEILKADPDPGSCSAPTTLHCHMGKEEDTDSWTKSITVKIPEKVP